MRHTSVVLVLFLMISAVATAEEPVTQNAQYQSVLAYESARLESLLKDLDNAKRSGTPFIVTEDLKVTPFTHNCSNVRSITCNSTVSGSLDDHDCAGTGGNYFEFWAFQGTQGQNVTIDMTSTAVDPYLGLLDPTPTVVATDDDGGPGLNARIVHTLGRSGTWTIAADSAYPIGARFGSYTLALACSGGGSPTTCTESSTNLCLSDGRFRVATTWRTADGQTGSGRAVRLTADTGYFWFFNESNIEMVVKVLNACSFSNRIWVFAGGLTNVQVTTTVTDTRTGTVKTYTNPQGTAFAPIQDTSAFATCP